MPVSEIYVGATPNRMMRGVRSLQGPHKDKKTGEEFTPQLLRVHSIDDLLKNKHTDDLHFTTYTVDGAEALGWPRLTKEGYCDYKKHDVNVSVRVFAFDWDCPNHNDWNDEHMETFFTAFSELDGPLADWRYFYTSKHGSRLIYVLSEGVGPEDAEQYITTMFLMFKKRGLEMDSSCSDWTRLFRLPNVVRDGVNTWEADYYAYDEQDGALLDISKIHRTKALIAPRLRGYEEGRHGQPSPEDTEELLKQVSDAGNKVASDFYKDAKKHLKGNNCYDALFKANVQIAGAGERNDMLMQSLGSAIPIIINKIRYATPEHVYALYYGPITALERTRDWEEWLWNAISSIWPVEIEKFNQKELKRADSAGKAVSIRAQIAEGMRTWCNHPELQDQETEADFVDRHLLANFGKHFCMLDERGQYTPFWITSDQLVARIRTSFLKDVIPTTKLGNTGQMVDIADKAIQNGYSTPVRSVEAVPQLESDGYIQGLDGMNPILKLPMYRRNPRLQAEYSEEVDRWLEALFGINYELATNWIGHALAFEEGPICALSMETAGGAGKQMLIEGLAECLEEPEFAQGKTLTGSSNGMMMKTPFLHINEEWPKGMNGSALEKMKEFTGGDRIMVKELYKPPLAVRNPLRVIMTANNNGLIKSVLDKDMTLGDREAIGERILHFELGSSATEYLNKIGGRRYTGRDGHRWVAGSDGKSDYLVAKHFLWLFENRNKDAMGFRYLVDGNMGGESTFMRDMVTQKESTSKVARAIFMSIEKGNDRKGAFVAESSGALYVTVEMVSDALRLQEMPMSFADVLAVMRNITATQHPIIHEHKEYHELDCATLISHAKQAGVDVPKLRGIANNQEKLKLKARRDASA